MGFLEEIAGIFLGVFYFGFWLLWGSWNGWTFKRQRQVFRQSVLIILVFLLEKIGHCSLCYHLASAQYY